MLVTSKPDIMATLSASPRAMRAPLGRDLWATSSPPPPPAKKMWGPRDRGGYVAKLISPSCLTPPLAATSAPPPPHLPKALQAPR